MKKQATIICTALMIMGAFLIINWIPEVSATTWTVGPGQQFATIGEALNAASDGDTIYVYCGNGYSESNQITKSVSIIGIINNGQRPIINRYGNSPVFDIKKQDVTICNLEILGHYDSSTAVHGIRSGVSSTEVSNVEIDNCKIYGFTGGNGILLNKQGGENPYPTNHYIHDCIIYENNIGIRIISNPNIQGALTNHVISGCNIYDNYLAGVKNEGDNNEFNDIESYHNNYYGIYFLDSSGCKLYQTETGSTNIYDNTYGIYIVNCEGIDITGYGNDSENDHLMIEDNNQYGIYAVSSDDIQLLYVIIQSNSLLSLNYESVLNSYMDYSIIKDNDIFLYNSDYNIFTYNDIYDSSEKIEIGLHGSDHNYFYYNNLDRESPSCFFNIFNSDDNTIEYYLMQNITVNQSSNNEIIDCIIYYPQGGERTGLKIIDSTYIYVNNTDIIYADLAINVSDSTDIYIDGIVGSPPPEPAVINGLTDSEILKVESDRKGYGSSVASVVYFSRYNYYDRNGVEYDIYLRGTAEYNTIVYACTLTSLNGNQYEVYEDNNSTWSYTSS